MLTIKTEKYSFLAKDPQAETFIEYMRDKYEWGGAEVEVEEKDGLISVSIETIHEINEIDLEDFKKKEGIK